MLGSLKRAPNQRLIDIAEGNVSLLEFADRFRIVPTIVAHFDHARKFDELPQQVLQILAVERSVLERDGKLNEQSAEFSGRGQRVESFAGQPFVFVIGLDCSGGSWLHHRDGRVSKRTMQL